MGSRGVAKTSEQQYRTMVLSSGQERRQWHWGGLAFEGALPWPVVMRSSGRERRQWHWGGLAFERSSGQERRQWHWGGLAFEGALAWPVVMRRVASLELPGVG